MMAILGFLGVCVLSALLSLLSPRLRGRVPRESWAVRQSRKRMEKWRGDQD